MDHGTQDKIKKLHQLKRTIKTLKKQGKKIVLCHGVFDLIHPGHIRYFHSAKKYGDVLIVTITADPYVKRGPERPFFKQELRAEVLAALEPVDYVAIVEHESAVEAIKALQPHYYVKGPDYKYRKPIPGIPRKLTEEEKAVRSGGGKLVFTDDIVFSSSHLINEYLEVFPPGVKEFIRTFRRKYTDDYIIRRLSSLKNLKILVIGEAIIDQYVYTLPMGKSSKDPIAAYNYISEESYAGGALATANHVAALSDNVKLLTLLGRKKSYESFIRKNLRPQVRPTFAYLPGANTVIKRRYIDEFTKQKHFYISYIKNEPISPRIERNLLRIIRNEIGAYDLVVVNDFGHGFLTDKIVRLICAKAKFLCLNVQANSANYGFNVITKYPRADFICIDEQELRLATHDRYGDIFTMTKKVLRLLNCRDIIVTRGPYGSLSLSKKDGFIQVPALSQKVIDRIGAGDALFAITAPCVYAGVERDIISFVGNVAAALKVQVIGNKQQTDFKEMTKFITRLLK